MVQSVTFSILALPPEGAFHMLTHFYHLWSLVQKNVHIFDRRFGCKIIKQNLSTGCDFSTMYISLRWSSRDLTDIFGVKVKTVKLIWGEDTDDGIHSDHGYLETWEIWGGPP